MTIEQLAFELKVLSAILAVIFLVVSVWAWGYWKEWKRIHENMEPAKDSRGAMTYRPKPGKVWNPMHSRWPANAPCPCGKRKGSKALKWKACCKPRMPKAVSTKEAEMLNKYIDDQMPALVHFMPAHKRPKLRVLG